MENIKVKYLFDDCGLCKQIFKDVNSNTYYMRLKNGEWMYARKDGNFYEPSRLVENSKSIFVIDNEGKIWLEDSNAEDKTTSFPLLSDFLKEKSDKLMADMNLFNYEEWKMFLIEDINKYNFRGYVDNWLHFHVFNCSKNIIDTISYLGEKLNIVSFKQRHSISDKEWTLYAIESPNRYTIEEIIGYDLKK